MSIANKSIYQTNPSLMQGATQCAKCPSVFRTSGTVSAPKEASQYSFTCNQGKKGCRDHFLETQLWMNPRQIEPPRVWCNCRWEMPAYILPILPPALWWSISIWEYSIQAPCITCISALQSQENIIHICIFSPQADFLLNLPPHMMCNRLQRWYVTIPSSDRWCTTIGNHHWQCTIG